MRWLVKITNQDAITTISAQTMARSTHPRRARIARVRGDQSLLAASTAAEVERTRDRTTKKQRKWHDHFEADAIIAWAEKEPLTLEQAQHVHRALGIRPCQATVGTPAEKSGCQMGSEGHAMPTPRSVTIALPPHRSPGPPPKSGQQIRSSPRSKHTRRRGSWPVKPAMTTLMPSWMVRRASWRSS